MTAALNPIKGGKATRHMLDKFAEDQAKDFMINKASPWNAVGEIVESIADIEYGGNAMISRLTSFSHSVCQ